MILELSDSVEKQAIARKVLEALPDWFGIEESRKDEKKLDYGFVLK